MSGIHRVGDLETNQDLGFQRRWWRVERIGWAVTVLILVAGMLGFFGKGPLASATAGSMGSPFWVEYPRFGRATAPGSLEVHLGPGAAPGGTARVWFDRAYLDGLQIERISPQPESVEAGADRLTYVFKVSNPDAAATVTFQFRGQTRGLRAAHAGLEGGPEVSFRQLFYP